MRILLWELVLVLLTDMNLATLSIGNFRKQTDTGVYRIEYVIRTMQVRFKIHCAGECQEDMTCMGFSIRRETPVIYACILSRGDANTLDIDFENGTLIYTHLNRAAVITKQATTELITTARPDTTTGAFTTPAATTTKPATTEFVTTARPDTTTGAFTTPAATTIKPATTEFVTTARPDTTTGAFTTPAATTTKPATTEFITTARPDTTTGAFTTPAATTTKPATTEFITTARPDTTTGAFTTPAATTTKLMTTELITTIRQATTAAEITTTSEHTTTLEPCICFNGGTCSYVGSIPTCACAMPYGDSQCQTLTGCTSIAVIPIPPSSPSSSTNYLDFTNDSSTKIEIRELKTDGNYESLQELSEGGGQWGDSVQIGTRIYITESDDNSHTMLFSFQVQSTSDWHCWIDMPPYDITIVLTD